MSRPDIEDWQSARRRRGETIRASNKSSAEAKTRTDKVKARAARFGNGDAKGTPLSPLKRGDRGGMFNPNANISGGIGRRLGADLGPGYDSPRWNASAPEATPQQPDRGARRRAIRDRIGKNSRSSSS